MGAFEPLKLADFWCKKCAYFKVWIFLWVKFQNVDFFVRFQNMNFLMHEFQNVNFLYVKFGPSFSACNCVKEKKHA